MNGYTGKSRWRLWAQLAQGGILVRQSYVGTKLQGQWNAIAGVGGSGQCVVYIGKATGFCLHTGNVFTPNGDPALVAVLSAVFTPLYQGKAVIPSRVLPHPT